MSGLLKKIEDIDKPAAAELMNADLQSDSDIQALTEDVLRDLLPGPENIKRRKANYDLIHSQPMEQQKLEASLTESGSHVSPSASDHPEELQITPSDGRPQAAPDSSPGSGTSDSSFEMLNLEDLQREVMSGLLKKIEDIYKPAAAELINADLQSDSDIQALTEDDLRDLLPGPENIKRRRAIYDLIHSQPMDQILKKLRGFIPEASLTGEVMSGLLKKIEDIDKPAADGLINAGLQSDSDIQALTEDDLRDLLPGIKNKKRRRAIYDLIHSQQKLEASLTATSYKMVVGGKTFDTHLTLMKKIKKQVQNQIQSCEDDADNHSVTFVFCPISSRVASDVEAAMSDVKDDKPVILVLMHHTHQVKATSTMKTWDVHANVVLHVNVFYHETRGLLQCDENDAAVTEIGNKLLDTFIPKSSITSGNAHIVPAEGGWIEYVLGLYQRATSYKW